MATITFTGPSIDNPGQQASKIITLPDSLMTLVLGAICQHHGYDPETAGVGPAEFAVRKSIEQWRSIALQYAQAQAQSAVEAALAAAIGPVQAGFEAITVETEEDV